MSLKDPITYDQFQILQAHKQEDTPVEIKECPLCRFAAVILSILTSLTSQKALFKH